MDVTLSNVPYFYTPPIRFLIHSVILPSHTLYRYEDTALHGKKCKNKAIVLQKKHILMAAIL